MMTQQELEKYLWGAATTLRGTIDAGDYKQYIFPLLFFKRISDVYDEEFDKALAESDGDLEYAAFAENHHFQIPDGAHWKDVREVTTNVGQALQNAMRAIEQANPDTLEGIFGDASWTNKERLSDAMLIELIEHYSQHKLNLTNVPDDKLGNAYEYLIKKFADDSGHTAAEFYTNRTVVKLMTMIMDPQPGESVYDPTCGSGGLLLNCALHLKEEGKEYRTLKLYGQEINLLTSAIARMNMFMHGIEEFKIVRGNTLSNPGLLENDELKKFNVILANPPYSIKSWDRAAFENDPYGRNLWGTPPQGCADYAFQQHIQKSLDSENGRACILWPYGVLFRDSEKDMRRTMIESDVVECVVALGKNLFYNSVMESCLLITNNDKSEDKKGKVLFIDARDEVKREKAVSYLTEQNILKILDSYSNFVSVNGFSHLASIEEISSKDFSLNVPLYVKSSNRQFIGMPNLAYKEWVDNSSSLKEVFFDSKFNREEEFDIETIIDSLCFGLDWQLCSFSDLVDNINEKVSPKKTALSKYIGLEHLDSGTLHIERFGHTSSLEGDKLKIYKGDIIFAKRNAYLKRVSKSNVDALVSAHSLVLREKRDFLVPEFLPYFLLSEVFWEKAIEISVGSLSPTINWKVLAAQQFNLPPKSTQQKLLSIFKAIDETVEKAKLLNRKARIAYEALREKACIEIGLTGETIFQSKLKRHVPESISFKPLSEFLTSIKYGTSQKTNVDGGGVGVLGIPNVVNEKLSLSNISFAQLDSKELESLKLKKNDILIVRSNGNPEYTGRSALYYLDEGHVYASYLIKISVDPEILDPEFLIRYLQTNCIRRYFKRHATSSAGNYNINTEAIRNVPVPRISLQEQKGILIKLRELEELVDSSSNYFNSAFRVMHELINKVF